MGASSAPHPLRAEPVERIRRIELLVQEAGATQERLASYLSLGDRPAIALLARERLERQGPGRFLYRSRPFRLLGFELVPTLALRVHWCDPQLHIRCEQCRIVGLGPWERVLDFEMAAILQTAPGGLQGELRVSLLPSHFLPGWGRALAGRGLEQVVERIERRVRRGLRKDLLAWVLDARDSC